MKFVTVFGEYQFCMICFAVFVDIVHELCDDKIDFHFEFFIVSFSDGNITFIFEFE